MRFEVVELATSTADQPAPGQCPWADVKGFVVNKPGAGGGRGRRCVLDTDHDGGHETNDGHEFGR